MASKLLVLAMALAAMCAGAAAQGNNFPWCNCVRTTSISPYSMSNPRTSLGGRKICWDLTAINPTATGRCAKFDLRKIEWNANPECRGEVESATFGGEDIAPSFMAYPDKGLTFKLTRGKGNLGTYAGLSGKTTRVCITLKSGKCSKLSTFCKGGKCDYVFFSPDNKCCPGQKIFPPPPATPVGVAVPMYPPPASPVDAGAPLPPETAFPYCPCNKNAPYTPYTISLVPTTSDAGSNTYCFNIFTNGYSGSSGSPCANTNLKKIEWDINLNCQMAVKKLTWNGQEIAASYTRWPSYDGLVFKVTRGSRDLATFNEVIGKTSKMCVTLRQGDCSTLSSFCRNGSCRVAFFSPNNTCCPVRTIAN